MQIYISKERDAITWEVRSTHDSNPKNWFSFDLVAELLGHNVDTGTMNTANAVLLKLEDRFFQFERINLIIVD